MKQNKEARFEELTVEKIASGACAPKDYRFCLLVHLPKGKVKEYESTYLQVIKEFKAEKNDPVRVFYVTPENRKIYQKLHEMVKDGFEGPGSMILWRPKRRKFKIVDDDVDARNPKRIISYVRNVIDGGSTLTSSHAEL